MTWCEGCSYPVPLDDKADTVTDPLTRETVYRCPSCGWRSDQQETRGQLGPQLEMEAVA
jgi:hypothetical protein